MGYIHSADNKFAQRLSGCGPGCSCSPCRKNSQPLGEWYVADEDEPGPAKPPEPAPVAAGRQDASRLSGPATGRLGQLGWDTRFLPFAWTEGHEILTRNAFRPVDARGVSRISFAIGTMPASRDLTPAEQNEIIEGNRDTDIQYARFARAVAPLIGPIPAFAPVAASTFGPAEQKHHALRHDYNQPQPAAVADIIADLQAQHRGILAEPNPRGKLRRIGRALHLIQDSFSPAHIRRRGSGAGWCIDYIRHYGRGEIPLFGSEREHRVPADGRDSVARHPGEAAQATNASARYLKIVFKAIYGRSRPDPAATWEAAAEFARFIAELLRRC